MSGESTTLVEHKSLHEAVLAAQGEIKTLPKTATNPHFKSKYTPLDTVVEIVGPILRRHGLTWMSMPSYDHETGLPVLRYQLTHAPTGNYINDAMPLLAPKSDPQAQGSAITYARRYAQCAVLNIVADEDVDGNVTGPVAAKPKPAPTSKTVAQVKTLTPDQAKKVATKLLEFQVTDEKLKLALVGTYGVNSLTELTIEQAKGLVAGFQS